MRAVALALLSTSACATAAQGGPAGEAITPAQASASMTCDAVSGQSLVGQSGTAELGARALRLTGGRALRWIRPGDMVTMDYREDRLNLELDSGNRVSAVRCG